MAESQAQPSLPSASPIGRFFGLFRRWPIVSLALIAILAFVAIFSPWISPQSPIKNSVRDRNAPPFWYTEWYEENPKAARTYILGADPIGRDVLSRLIHGARISSIVVVVALGQRHGGRHRAGACRRVRRRHNRRGDNPRRGHMVRACPSYCSP